MNLRKVKIEADRRESKRDLAELLKNLPIKIKGPDVKMHARVGMGNIVYIKAYEGSISDVVIEGFEIGFPARERILILDYKGRRYELSQGYISPD